MALKLAMLKDGRGIRGYTSLGINRLTHTIAMPSPINDLLGPTTKSAEFALPESNQRSNTGSSDVGLGFPCLPVVGSMELMAVPRTKVSRHKRGIRNGPKALKPTPVIIRCNGEKGNPGEQNGTTN